MNDIAPSDTDAEAFLLGGLLRNPEEIPTVIAEISEEDFALGVNAMLFQRIKEYWSFDVGPVDMHTVGSYLKDCSILIDRSKTDFEVIGGWQGLTAFVENVPPTFQPEAYIATAQRIREKRIKRDIIKRQDKIREFAANGKAPQEVLDTIQALVQEMTDLMPATKKQTPASVCDLVIDDIIKRRTEGVDAISSGLSDLDRIIYGFRPGAVIVLAGRPGMLKTQLALSFTHKAARVRAKRKYRTLFVSLEMQTKEIVERLFSQIGEVPSELLSTGVIGEHELKRLEYAKQEIVGLDPVLLDDNDKLNGLAAIEKEIVKRKRAGAPPDLVIVDYLQLLPGTKHRDSNNQNLEVEENSRGFKAMAKRHKIPIVILSQLSRAVESRMDKRPQLSDLRASGAIEQDADIVIFNYRHGYYYPECKEPNVLELIVAKHRQGKTGTAYVNVNLSTGAFSDTQDPFWKPDYGIEVQASKPRNRKGSTHAANTHDKENEPHAEKNSSRASTGTAGTD